jgi:hypothetical protein
LPLLRFSYGAGRWGQAVSFYKAEDFGDCGTVAYSRREMADRANAKRDVEMERLRAENAQLRIATADAGIADGRIARLREALEFFLERHIALVESGDCGFWNPETDPEVIKARAALGLISTQNVSTPIDPKEQCNE